MTEQKISQASLENLKLGGISRRKGKLRVTATIRPSTKDWLARGGNISERIDEIVRRIVSGQLVENPSPPKEFKSVLAIARKKCKLRVTVTILPQTKEWLARDGNVSQQIDEVVRRIVGGELVKKSE